MMNMTCFSLLFFCYLFLLAGVLFKTSNGQAYNNQYQRNANYPMNYQSQPYETNPCNDLLCKNNECCTETHVGPMCVPFITDDAICLRLKKCSSHSDCISGCCSIIMDISFAIGPKAYPANTSIYSNNNNNVYSANSYGYSSGNYGAIPSYSDQSNFRNGYCWFPSGEDEPCFPPIDGVATEFCPCEDGTVCTIDLEPFPFGHCRGTGSEDLPPV